MLRVFFVLCCVRACAGGRLLVVFPTPGPSHNIVGHSIVDILLEEGHEVTYVTAFPKDVAKPGLKYVDISSVRAAVAGGEQLNLEKLAKNPRPMHKILQIGPTFYKRSLLHPAVQDLLKDPEETFDAVIVEWFYSGLAAPLAAVFECPLIWYSAADVSWQTLSFVHEASSPAYTAELNSREAPSLPYSFTDRAYQLWVQVYLSGWKYYVTHSFEIPAYAEIYKEPLQLRGRSLPNYEALVYNASLMLVNSHPPLGQKIPLPQNVKYVGGHHIQLPTLPLPENIKRVMDSAKHGVIYFSMGSNLKSKDFPDSVKRDLVMVLGQLEQTVLWKFEEELEDLPRNVHILDWAPQASILNHPNTVLFISHGGMLSFLEATQFGVPIVGIPLFGDQFVNVDLVQARGCGRRVDFGDNLPLKILEAINEVVGNSSYSDNARQASAIFRRRLQTPQKELAHWVQLVLAARGGPTLQSPATLVPFAERLYLDMLFLILMLLWFFSKVVKVVRVMFVDTDGDNEKKNR